MAPPESSLDTVRRRLPTLVDLVLLLVVVLVVAVSWRGFSNTGASAGIADRARTAVARQLGEEPRGPGEENPAPQ